MKRNLLAALIGIFIIGINIFDCAAANQYKPANQPNNFISLNDANLIPNDFSIFWEATRIIPNNFPLYIHYSRPADCKHLGYISFDELKIVEGDLVQIGILIRDNGFKDYIVKFSSYDFYGEKEIAEIKGKETISTGDQNAIAFAEWQALKAEQTIFDETNSNRIWIKVKIIPQERITKDLDRTNNELWISSKIVKKAEKGFYYGIPASSEKKIALVVFQEKELEPFQKLIKKIFPKNFSSPLKELLNPEGLTFGKSGNSIPSVFYLKQFLSEESKKYTGKNLFPDIKIEIFGPFYGFKVPSDDPISFMRNEAINQGANLDKYDIVAYIYLPAEPQRSAYAKRETRELYAEFLPDGKTPKTSIIFHEIMHLFGASDHYFGYAKMSNPPDIMADSSIMDINCFTAEEIGWFDRNHNGIIDAEEPNLYQ